MRTTTRHTEYRTHADGTREHRAVTLGPWASTTPAPYDWRTPSTRLAMTRGSWVEAPEVYVVLGGNALWLDGNTVLGCPLSSQGTVLWEDTYEVEDYSGMDPELVLHLLRTAESSWRAMQTAPVGS